MALSSSSSSRWCPTPEQVMILEDIYNKAGGIKTPNAFQIQQITNHLSFYGKIEGKNVFYWFQNHKARERHKLRRSKFMQIQKQHLQLHQPPCWYHLYSPLPQGGRPPGAAGVHRCWPDINGIGAGVQRSFQSQLCSVGQPLLKTLELFPLKSTNLNSNANPNKDPTSSSSSSSRSPY